MRILKSRGSNTDPCGTPDINENIEKKASAMGSTRFRGLQIQVSYREQSNPNQLVGIVTEHAKSKKCQETRNLDSVHSLHPTSQYFNVCPWMKGVRKQ